MPIFVNCCIIRAPVAESNELRAEKLKMRAALAEIALTFLRAWHGRIFCHPGRMPILSWRAAPLAGLFLKSAEDFPDVVLAASLGRAVPSYLGQVFQIGRLAKFQRMQRT
jgi:hypothetical protein